jgi:RNA polymerase sigma-70 factor, ECF subfamily
MTAMFASRAVPHSREATDGQRYVKRRTMSLEPGSERRDEGEAMLPEMRERHLLRRIGAREATAIEELYHLYHRRLARFLTRITSRYELTEEIINDTFWVIWQHADSFRGESRVSTWIFGIAYRRALKTLRAARKPDVLAAMDPDTAIEEPCRQAELNEWLGEALARLPPQQRMVIELAYHAGHSCEEISAIMQCPVNTVKTRMFHARRKLRTLLAALGGTDLG